MLLHDMSISETPLARIERTGPSRVEIRFRPDVYIDAQGIAEIFQERIRLCGKDHVQILMVMPPGVEIDLAVMATDHFKVNNGVDGVLAMATVAGSSMNEMLASLFFAYFPQGFPARMFPDEREAEEWLASVNVKAGT
jgi:hypothetical protein